MEKNRNGYPIRDERNQTGAPIGNGAESRENLMNNHIRTPGVCTAQDTEESDGACDEVKLAYVYAPSQKFCMLFAADEATMIKQQ